MSLKDAKRTNSLQDLTARLLFVKEQLINQGADKRHIATVDEAAMIFSLILNYLQRERGSVEEKQKALFRFLVDDYQAAMGTIFEKIYMTYLSRKGLLDSPEQKRNPIFRKWLMERTGRDERMIRDRMSRMRGLEELKEEIPKQVWHRVKDDLLDHWIDEIKRLEDGGTKNLARKQTL